MAFTGGAFVAALHSEQLRTQFGETDGLRVDHFEGKVGPALQTPIDGALPAVVNPEIRHAMIRGAVFYSPHHHRIKVCHALQTPHRVALLTIVKPERHRTLRGGHAGGVPVDGGVVEVELAL